jgi:hypothetical protein
VRANGVTGWREFRIAAMMALVAGDLEKYAAAGAL